jgi:HD-like signal output (HDOD) protein
VPSAGGVAVLEADRPAVALEPHPWWAPEGASRIERGPVKCPDLPPEARAVADLLVSHFDGHDLTLPSLPRVAERVLRRLAGKDCSFTRIADDIAEDQVMAATVLRTANSPMYRGQQKFTALLPAVTRLGVKSLRVLMMQHALRAATRVHREVDRELAEAIWRRSLAGAVVMRNLARFTSVQREDAFMMGLLHDIGNVVVLRVVSGQETMTRDLIDLKSFEYLCYECQQEFGELIATEWKLPHNLQSLIADHHDYPAPGDPLRTERLQLILTDMILEMIGYSPFVAYDLLNTRAVKDLNLSDNPAFLDALAVLPQQVDEAMSSFS